MRRLVDAQMRWARAGKAVYLRLRDFPDIQNTDWAQLGFAIAPSGSAKGTSDILIDPPPAVNMISLHNIGQSMGKLRFGARLFVVSATFVARQVVARGIVASNGLSAEDLVWRSPNVVGLVTQGLLFSIEDVGHEEYGVGTVTWLLTCNSTEVR